MRATLEYRSCSAKRRLIHASSGNAVLLASGAQLARNAARWRSHSPRHRLAGGGP